MRVSLARFHFRVGLHIVLFEVCSAFTRVAACTLARSPIRDRYPRASDISSPPCLPRLLPAGAVAGWALHPLEKRRLVTAHAETGHFDVPPPCGHAGGLAAAANGKLYIADTHTLFVTELAGAFDGPMPRFHVIPLGPGVTGGLAGSGAGEIWLGRYNNDRPGRLYRFPPAALGALSPRAGLNPPS